MPSLLGPLTRISDLVGAMKAYSYMDQGLDKQVIDLREGIVNTLIILKHKWKKKDIHIVKKFEDVPKISAYGSELNQVWTNLIIDDEIVLPPASGCEQLHISVSSVTA